MSIGQSIAKLPLFVILIGISAGAMLLPSIVALGQDDMPTSRVFFYSAILFFILAMLLGFVTTNSARVQTGWTQLITLLLAYLLLPLILAFPMDASMEDARFFTCYIDMVSSLTTTGASFFDAERLSDPLVMWRATVGWFGGFLIWLSAIAILAPLNLGGYEVTSEAQVQGLQTRSAGQMRAASPEQRLVKHARRLAPTYIALTIILWVLLMITGSESLPALIHAMSTLSTSGISLNGQIGSVGAEAMVLIFFIFALSRRSFTHALNREYPRRMLKDREVRLALAAIVIVPALFFLRHWFGAVETETARFSDAVESLWGGIFTVASFLTTTGFVSQGWDAASQWSGIDAPGMVLIGLALMGGGVATTAGGVKLLRVYALYKHGLREVEKLIHPHSVAGAGRLGRRIRREGAYIAWVFFMLLTLSMALFMCLLAATGLDFETAMILTILALTTTGPLAAVGGETAISFTGLNDLAKMLLAFAMIVGRMETLVLVALISPRFWRG